MMAQILVALVALPAVVGALLLFGGLGRGHTARLLQVVAAPVTVATAGLVLVGALLVALTNANVTLPFLSGGPLGMGVDGLSALLVVTVAVVSLLVLLFAVGEIADSRSRFFGLMLVFVAAVLLTVTATTLTALLAGWEVMGATSYALIGFWWRDRERVESGTTALVVTRLADLGLYVAAGAAFAGFASVPALRDEPLLALSRLSELPTPWVHVAAAGVLTAAFGKAAQLPFSFWISRAMAGPSPVSALLHSAAMVAMGGYLLLRLQPLLAAAGWAADVAAWGGAVTALVMGAVAVAQRDLKQLLAASTSSQLGFVMLAAGITASGGAVPAGAMQLIAHAFTKGLLFLAAGAWLTALGTKSLVGLRGAARSYRLVGVTFTIGALALAGVPPLSLWVTKDEVLAAARAQSLPLYLTGLAAAVMSGLYAGKAVAMVWRRPPPHGNAQQVLENVATGHVGFIEKVVLAGMSVAAALLGIVGLPFVDERVRAALGVPAASSVNLGQMGTSGLLAAATVALALRWPQRLDEPRWLLGWLGAERASAALVVRPTLALSRWLARFDDEVLDAAVERTVPAVQRIAARAARIDDTNVDGTVRAVISASQRLADVARRPQTGQLHQYYAQAAGVLGAAVLLLLITR